MKRPFRSTPLDAELAVVLREEKERWAPASPPHPAVYVHTSNYLTHVINSIKDYVYFRCFLQQNGDHPDLDDDSCSQGCAQFASVNEAREYLNRLLAIAQTFTAQPYADGYLEGDLIAGPVELLRMQHLLNVASIELSEFDRDLLRSGQYVKRGGFENEYLNQTVRILVARELVGSLDAYFSHLEACAIDFRDIERTMRRLKKLPFFRIFARYETVCTLKDYRYYAERDCKNIIHVSRRNAELIKILYGGDSCQMFPFHGMPLCNSDSASDLVWQYVDSIVGASASEAEWQQLPLSQFSDVTLLQTIKLHYKVNHLILARRDYCDMSNDESAFYGVPENRLTPDEFVQCFPKLAHLKRFVSLQNCDWNPYLGDGTDRRTAIIPILDEYCARRSITKFFLD